MSTRLALAVLGAVVAAACIGTSPEQRAMDALGPDPNLSIGKDDEGPEHRAGQPCLVCHRESFAPGEAVFDLAGTIYARPGDTVGVGGVEVFVTDARGRFFTAVTNRAGNFMVSHDGDGGGPGWLQLTYEPAFPLRVVVRQGAAREVMVSSIHREGSCAYCHTHPPGARSNGRVYLMAEP